MISETPLQSPFCFWYMRRGKGTNSSKNKEEDANANATTLQPQSSQEQQQQQSSTAITTTPTTTASSTTITTAATTANPYENSIKQIAKVSTVEEFWTVYNHLQRPNNLPTTTDYHFFRHGIKPTWEDPSNAKGGKWIVRLRKGLASRYWEEIVLALIGCQFTGIPYNEVCGAVVSIRYSEDIVSVWNKTAHDRDITDRLRDCIKKILQLPGFVHMEYKPHETSLQDKSSFRNTKVWKPKSIADGERGSGGSGASSRRGMTKSGSWGNRDELRGDSDRGVSTGNKHSSWRSASSSN